MFIVYIIGIVIYTILLDDAFSKGPSPSELEDFGKY